jgi:hypothetical protein
MAEGKVAHTAEQKKESTKRPPWWKRLWDWTEFGNHVGFAAGLRIDTADEDESVEVWPEREHTANERTVG